MRALSYNGAIATKVHGDATVEGIERSVKIFSRIEDAVAVGILSPDDRHIADLRKAAGDFPPGGRVGIEEGEAGTTGVSCSTGVVSSCSASINGVEGYDVEFGVS